MFNQILGLIWSPSKIFFPQPLHLNDQENLQNQSYSSSPATSHIPKATNSSDTKQLLPTRAPHSSSDAVLLLVYLGLLASSHPSVRMIMAVRDRKLTQISFDRAGSTAQWQTYLHSSMCKGLGLILSATMKHFQVRYWKGRICFVLSTSETAVTPSLPLSSLHSLPSSLSQAQLTHCQQVSLCRRCGGVKAWPQTAPGLHPLSFPLGTNSFFFIKFPDKGLS